MGEKAPCFPLFGDVPAHNSSTVFIYFSLTNLFLGKVSPFTESCDRFDIGQRNIHEILCRYSGRYKS